MEIYKHLSEIKKAYERGENIIQLLKKDEHEDSNSIADILVSYDLQAGSYTNTYRKRVDFVTSFASAVEKIVTKYAPGFASIMEAGMGEATTLANVLKSFKEIPQHSFGFDISWSRREVWKPFFERTWYSRLSDVYRRLVQYSDGR